MLCVVIYNKILLKLIDYYILINIFEKKLKLAYNKINMKIILRYKSGI